MWPDKRRDELPIMPKGRYEIMLDTCRKVGSLGLDMMLRTCTIQVNLDYSSEADMVKKFRVGLALQPVATALVRQLAVHRRQAQRLSRASAATSGRTPTRDRTGMLPFVFEDGFGYERYLDYALDVPMYFVFRDGKYIDVAGAELPRFPRRQAAAAARREAAADRLHRPSVDRLPRSAAQELPRDARRRRRALEPDLRAAGACGSACSTTTTALDAAWDLVKHWTIEEREALAPRRAEAGARRAGARRRDDARPRARGARHRVARA